MKEQVFPISKLNMNIINILQKCQSVNIHNLINNGLNHKIQLIDSDSKITNVAEIKGTNCGARIILSIAYCQYLWLICDISLKKIDYFIFKENINEYGGNIEDAKCFIETLIRCHDLYKDKHESCNIAFEDYLLYLSRILSLLKVDDFDKNVQKEIFLAKFLKDNTVIDISAFNTIDIKGNYEEVTNAAYCYGTAFIILHEMSHFDLKHLDSVESKMQDEIDADYSAFWIICNDLNGKDLFSAIVGILCALFSLLILNPKMEEDGVHPREVDRILYILNQIGEDREKYVYLVVHMLKYWAKEYDIKTFPIVSDGTEESLQNIQNFINNYKRN